MKNVFSGEDSIKKYLNPDNHPPLPLVELPLSLNPHREKGIRIFLKLMHFLPLANVKSLPAYNMLDEAERGGLLDGVHSLVESSSGNTVLSLAVLARSFGIKRTLALASKDVEQGKLDLLRFLGTDVRVVEEDICPDPSDPTSGVNQAKALGREAGWFNPGQYHNHANPRAHERWTGPQIWDQTDGKITHFVAGLGTTGTLYGTSSYLKRLNPGVQTIGVTREPNNPVPGVRTKNLLSAIEFDWEGSPDKTIPIGTLEAYQTSLALCRVGILVGPSAGFAVAGFFEYLASLSAADIDSVRNEDGELIAVAIAPDSPFPYVEEYFRYLGDDAFPVIENIELLGKQELLRTPLPANLTYDDVSIAPRSLISKLWGISLDDLRSRVESFEEVPTRERYTLIDVRSEREFRDHHLPGSDREEYSVLAESFEDVFLPALKEARVTPIFVCSYGGKSAKLAIDALKAGVEAYSLKGGTIEWSRLNLPRIKGPMCVS